MNNKLDPKKIYENAFAYKEGSDLITPKPLPPDSAGRERFRLPILPKITCLTFSLELFLKTLLAIENTNKFGHKFTDLYDKLTPESKTMIGQYLFNIGISQIQFEETLKEINNAFVEWRYVHEKVRLSLDISFLEKMIEATIDTIHKQRPDIKNRVS